MIRLFVSVVKFCCKNNFWSILYDSFSGFNSTCSTISINEDELNFFGNRFDNACMDITIRNEDDYSDSYTQTVNMIKL